VENSVEYFASIVRQVLNDCFQVRNARRSLHDSPFQLSVTGLTR